MRLFKRRYRKKEEDAILSDENEIMQLISKELYDENSLAASKEGLVDTNRLPDIQPGLTAEVLNSFSDYLFYSGSNCGMVRKSNQDSVFTGSFKIYASGKEITAGLGIVADGIGGLTGGEIASASAVGTASTYLHARLCEYAQNIISGELPRSSLILSHISGAMQSANKIIFDRGRLMGQGIGTTFTGAFFLGSTAYFGHAGDSRGYIIDTQSRTIDRVTRDHSLVGRLVESGQITEAQAKSHPRRNEIYKMLGLRSEIKPDTYCRLLNPDSVIVLLSDGLWEFVDDSTILDEIINSNDYDRSVKKLIGLANKNGGDDNISIIIIKPVIYDERGICAMK